MRKLFILSVSSLLIMSLLIFGVGCEYLESQTPEQEAATESTTEDSTTAQNQLPILSLSQPRHLCTAVPTLSSMVLMEKQRVQVMKDGAK